MSSKKTYLFVLLIFLVALLAPLSLWYYPQFRTYLPDFSAKGKERHTVGTTEGRHEEETGKGDAHGQPKNGDDHGEEELVRLSEQEIRQFGIELGVAAGGMLQTHVELPGEVSINADRLAHVVPRVPGIVRQVNKSLGDQVKTDEIMAVLESRDLADAKAEFLTARERVQLAQANFNREESLWQKKISAEQEYLNARQALAEARINLRSAEQKLHALGFGEAELKGLETQHDVTYTRYELRAPFTGTVIQKHISLGEVLKDDAEVFMVADLSSVWVDLQVYQKDLAVIRKGQSVTVVLGHGIPDATGIISYVGPLVAAATRTVLARVVLPNPEGVLRPGMFITAKVATGSVEVPLLVPKTALQTFENNTVVFVLTEKGFQPVPITIGRSNTSQVEALSGLKPGQTFVTSGAFTLKAELSKGAFGDGHSH